VLGSDGALWLAERNSNNKIGRMTTAGELTHEYPIPTESANPLAPVAAPDGTLYFTQHAEGTVARMTLGGVVTKDFRLPSGSPDVTT
jgi:virginiamycin B lyase